MPLSAAAAGAGGRRLLTGVELSAGQAHPGDPLLVPKKIAAGEGFQVLHEPAGMQLICFCHAAEGCGDAGIAFLLGGAGIKGTALVPDGVLIRCCGTKQIDGLARQGRRFFPRRDIAAAMHQQPFQDGDVLGLLGGSEAEGVGDDMQAVFRQETGCVQIMPVGAALVP